MKLADARPGDILQDESGAVWLRGTEAARCLNDPADKRNGDCNSAGADAMAIEEAEPFGPFVRLVPETEAARLQAEVDALRAIVESGCDACAHATPNHPASQEATLAEARGMLDDDDLRGLADKGAT